MLVWILYNIKFFIVYIKIVVFMDFSRERKKIKLFLVIRKNFIKINWRWYEKRIYKKIVIKIYLLLNEIENGYKIISKYIVKDFVSFILCTIIFLNFVLLI